MKGKKIICPTCKQDMREAPRKGWHGRDCEQCGQGLTRELAVKLQKHRVIEFR